MANSIIKANIGAVLNSYEGDIVTIKSPIERPFIMNMQADINPIQDLHGYDKPWAGGNGKNLLPMTIASLKADNTQGTWSGNTYSINGGTFAVQTDDDGNVTGILVNCDGTNSQVPFLNIKRADLNGSFIVNGCPSGGSWTPNTWRLRVAKYNGTYITQSFGGDTSFTTDGGVAIQISIGEHYAVSNLLFKPMVRLATESATFEPYSNICPISGWTECDIYNDPVYGGTINWNQLVQNGNFVNTSNWNSGGSFTVSNNIGTFKAASQYANVTQTLSSSAPNHKYLFMVTAKAYSNNGVYVLLRNMTSISPATYTNIVNEKLSTSWQTITKIVESSNDCVQLRVYAQDNNSSGWGNIELKNYMLIDLTQMFGAGNEPSTVGEFKSLFPKDYYAYNTGEETCVSAVNGNEYKHAVIDLDGTRYSGTLDVMRGVMVIDKKIYRAGDLSQWDYASNVKCFAGWLSSETASITHEGVPNCLSSYYRHIYPLVDFGSLSSGDFAVNTDQMSSGNKRLVVKDYRYTSVTDFLADNADATFVIPLATPLTVQLTPQQIEAIVGENNIWCSTGQTKLTALEMESIS